MYICSLNILLKSLQVLPLYDLITYWLLIYQSSKKLLGYLNRNCKNYINKKLPLDLIQNSMSAVWLKYKKTSWGASFRTATSQEIISSFHSSSTSIWLLLGTWLSTWLITEKYVIYKYHMSIWTERLDRTNPWMIFKAGAFSSGLTFKIVVIKHKMVSDWLKLLKF